MNFLGIYEILEISLLMLIYEMVSDILFLVFTLLLEPFVWFNYRVYFRINTWNVYRFIFKTLVNGYLEL